MIDAGTKQTVNPSTSTKDDLDIAEQAAEEKSTSRRWISWTNIQRLGLLLGLAAVIVIFSIARPHSFATMQNLASILSGSAALTLVSLGIMLPLIVQQYDLSVAYVASIASLLTIGVMSKNGWPVWQAIALGLVVSVVIGVINGLLVGYAKLNSLVVTLGMGSVAYGMSMLYSGGELIFSDIPASFKALGQARPFGIPVAFVYAFVIAIILWYFLSYRRTGRHLYAIGGSETAAKLAGMRVPFLVLVTFTLSALLSGLGGIVQAARVGSSSADSMTSFLLPAFTAAFLGATAIRLGQFNVWGTVLAVYLIATGSTGMYMLGAPTYVEPVFNGLVLLVAISLAGITMRRNKKDRGVAGTWAKLLYALIRRPGDGAVETSNPAESKEKSTDVA
jgi:ribose transport system permease protein